MSGLEIDFETRSAVELKKRGVYNYMASPTTEPLMASYRLNGGPVRRWRPPEPCPADIREHVEAGGMISAHNAAFERLLWQMILTPRYGWPAAETRQFRCTAGTAAALSLPRSLGDLGAALGLTLQKDKEGARLIRKFSLPKRDGSFEPPAGPDFERFHDYCDVDVLTEAEADSRMVPLSADEQDYYSLSEAINDRGIRIDRRSAEAAIRLAEKAKKQLDADMRIATGGRVTACSQAAKLVEWIQEQGVELSSAAKANLEDALLQDDIPAHVRRAIELRQEAAKASVSKLNAMIDRAGGDGRVRGTGLYHAAGTGRTQSVGVNFSNLPRPRKDYENAHLDTATLFDAFRQEEPDYLRLLYGPKLGRPLHLVSDAIRGFIWAAPGHDLLQADYSGIEGAVIAWSSGEEWKAQALREIMADPELPDLYRRAAAQIMGTTTDEITKKHPLRQSVGKTSELALGFGGGVSALHAMAKNYGVALDPLFDPVWASADEERREKASRRYEACLKRGKEKTDLLSREAWIAAEIIKVGWRAANPAIAGGWRLREDAVREAIRNPGTQTTALKFSYLVAHGFLWCRLPSGRCLAYASPKLKDQVWAKILLDDGSWSDSEVMDREEAERLEREGEVKIEGSTSPAISALGVDGKTKKFVRQHLYGGLLAENDTQAVARDLLVNGVRRAEAASYPVIFTVYDEIVTEVPRDFGDVKAFERLICELPAWADGLPLTAGGWRGKRYRKD